MPNESSRGGKSSPSKSIGGQGDRHARSNAPAAGDPLVQAGAEGEGKEDKSGRAFLIALRQTRSSGCDGAMIIDGPFMGCFPRRIPRSSGRDGPGREEIVKRCVVSVVMIYLNPR